MFCSITAVALRTVRHNDRSSILTAWSASHGRLSLVMPAGNGKESRRRRALTMPMGLFECVVNLRDTEQLQQVRDLRAWGPDGIRPDVSADPVRSAIAMFTAEVLTVVTREGAPDPALWNLIVETAVHIAYAPAPSIANMPWAFLVRLANILGIAPDITESTRGKGLDMTDGVLRFSAPLTGDWLPPEQTAKLRVCVQAAEAYRHIRLVRLPRSVRSSLLEGIIKYFALHNYPLERLRSVDILTTVFS